MILAWVFGLASVIVPASASAPDPIGPHARLMTFEKSENPQNILIVYTQTDGGCRFRRKEADPLVDVYWLMNRKSYKPTHRLIKRSVRAKFEFKDEPNAQGRAFVIQPKEFPDVSPPVHDPRFEVRSESDGNGGCKVAMYFKDGVNRPVKVNTIYGETRPSLRPPFQKLVLFRVRGVDIATGKAVERQYSVK